MTNKTAALILAGIGASISLEFSPLPAKAQICEYLWESACDQADVLEDAAEEIKFKKPCEYLFPGACGLADNSEDMMDLVLYDVEEIWIENRDAAINSIGMTWLARRRELIHQAETAWLDTRNELVGTIEDEVGFTMSDLDLAKEFWDQAKGGLAILEKGLPGIQKEYGGRIRACINKGMLACTEDIKVGIESGGYVYACVNGDYGSCIQALKSAKVSPSKQAPLDPTAGYFPPKQNTIFQKPRNDLMYPSLISATFIAGNSGEALVQDLTLRKVSNPYGLDTLPYPDNARCPYYNGQWNDGVWSAYALCEMREGRGKATVYSKGADGNLVHYKYAEYTAKNNITTIYGYRGDITKLFNFSPKTEHRQNSNPSISNPGGDVEGGGDQSFRIPGTPCPADDSQCHEPVDRRRRQQ
jgi:hypothetical protein